MKVLQTHMLEKTASTVLIVCLLIMHVSWGRTGQQERDETSYPELEFVLEQVRKNLNSDRMLLSNYTYNEVETVRFLDKDSTVKRIKEKRYEVFPSFEEELLYRKLVEEDGEPVSKKDLEKQDRKYRKRVKKWEKKLRKKGTSDEEARRLREEEEGEKEQRAVDDVFRLYEFELLGRGSVGKYSTYLIGFSPRPDYKPRVKEVKLLKKISGKAWVCDEDFQLVRIEADLIENASFGLGILAKLHKGATMSFQRRKVNDELWLPSVAHFSGKGRFLLFKGFRVDLTSEYSDYRRFSVSSSITFSETTQEELK